jgi:hypothetical protein
VGFAGEIHPFFVQFECEVKEINEQPDLALTNLIARNPVMYKKTLFRAFLNYSKKECDKMTLTEYLNSNVILESVLKIWHSPFIDHTEN